MKNNRLNLEDAMLIAGICREKARRIKNKTKSKKIMDATKSLLSEFPKGVRDGIIQENHDEKLTKEEG